MPRWRRWVCSLALALPLLHAQAAPARAAATLTLAPLGNLPHGTEQFSGTGFDPNAQVALSITNSAGTSNLGALTADATGAVSGTLTLPLTLDVTGQNTITAREATGQATAAAVLTGLPVSPALGSGQQISGRLGGSVSVRAVGFAPLDPIAITVGGAPVMIPPGVPTPISGADGSVQLIFAIPAAATPGQDLIVATGAASGLGQHDSASLPINIVGTQGLAATPNPARAGSTIAVAGSGFSPGEAVAITVVYTDTTTGGRQQTAQDARADAGGAVNAPLLLPPTAQAGTTATLTARGIVSGFTQSLPLAIVGSPTVTASAATVEPGQQLTISGTGFAPGERLYLTTALATAPSGGIIADATGAFTIGQMVHPLVAPGSYPIVVSGVEGDLASTRVIVPTPSAPVLRLAPATAAPGATIQIQGSAFLANEPVRLMMGETVITPTTGPIVAGAAGAFSANVRIPDVPASGVYALQAEGLLTGARGRSTVRVQLPPVSLTYFAEGYTGQGPQVDFGERIDLLNTNAVTATGQIDYFLGSGITSTVSLSIPPRTHLSEDVNNDIGSNHMVSAMLQFDQHIDATRTITRTTAAGQALGESISVGENALSAIWYFAEGYTGVSFQEYLSLFNPSGTAANVTVQPVGVTGSSAGAPLVETVAPHSRVTVNMRAAQPNRQLGLIVQSDQPIAAERVVYWGDGAGSSKYGTAVSGGIQQPAATWAFPYVSTTGSDQVFMSFLDPTTVAAHVQLTVYGPSGAFGTGRQVTVQPGTRATVALPAGAAPSGIVAASDVPVIAEEAQYFGGSPNIGRHAGSVVPGLPQAATSWTFPGFDTSRYTNESWYILNTGAGDAKLTATLYSVQAQPVHVSFRAASRQLTSVSLQNMSGLQGASPSAWSSSVPVVIVQVLRGSPGTDGALVPGSLAAP